jgi:hypothetical protein
MCIRQFIPSPTIGAKVKSHSARNYSSSRFKAEQPIGGIEQLRKTLTCGAKPITAALLPDELTTGQQLNAT